jgi:hypothetical protein
MESTNGAVKETLVGVVEATNEKGIRVQGRWFNFSRYHDVPRPEKGQQVALEARGNFINRLTIAAPTAAPPAETSTPVASTASPASPVLDTIDLRERRIIRQTVLKVAANFLALRPEAKLGEVIRTAELLEKWVMRS